MSHVFMFHEEHAPEGKKFAIGEEPKGKGWVDTPAKFDPDYVEPPKIGAEPGTVPEEARRRGYVPQPYPSTRYHQDGRSVVVESAEDDAQYDPKEWLHTPPEAVEADEADAPPAPKAKAAKKEKAPKGETAEQREEREKAAADALAAKAQELHATSVEDALKALKGCKDVDLLTRTKEMEMLNVDGPRRDLVKALDKQLAGLKKKA